jgi:uncharacterized membrane protein (DUF2068 family)
MPDPALLPPSGPTRRRLPVALYILAGVMLFRAFLAFSVVAGATTVSLEPAAVLSSAPALVDLVKQMPWAGPAFAAYGAVLVIAALGMLGRRRTGWLLAMVVTGVFIALDLYSFANNEADHLWMALNIVTVFYLNQRDVRAVVGVTASMGISALEAFE